MYTLHSISLALNKRSLCSGTVHCVDPLKGGTIHTTQLLFPLYLYTVCAACTLVPYSTFNFSRTSFFPALSLVFLKSHFNSNLYTKYASSVIQSAQHSPCLHTVQHTTSVHTLNKASAYIANWLCLHAVHS